MDLQSLKTKLEDLNIKYELNKPLKDFTTFKIGGPADILVKASTKEELIAIIRAAKTTSTPLIVLGWGSNVLISDDGISGLTIINKSSNITIHTENGDKPLETAQEKVEARLTQIEKNSYYNFEDLDYSEEGTEKISVNIESGAPLPSTIMNLLRQGYTGLQWFGGIPGTFGGAVYNNIHGGNHFISEYIASVEVINKDSLEIATIDKKDCNFGYDTSRFHSSHELILSANLLLNKGDKERAKSTYIEWTRRKKIQPQISAGCVWKNISETQRIKLELESTSWGYIIDKVLNLKGKQIGGARISPQHAAFIENAGNAKASDVTALMELIKSESKAKLGITPESEIFLIN